MIHIDNFNYIKIQNIQIKEQYLENERLDFYSQNVFFNGGTKNLRLSLATQFYQLQPFQ